MVSCGAARACISDKKVTLTAAVLLLAIIRRLRRQAPNRTELSLWIFRLCHDAMHVSFDSNVWDTRKLCAVRGEVVASIMLCVFQSPAIKFALTSQVKYPFGGTFSHRGAGGHYVEYR